MKKLRRGMYIGRFQPYHLGHSSVLQAIVGEIDEVIIGIGSAQESYHPNNPFTAGERVLMVSKALEEFDIKSYIIPVEDVHCNSLWVSRVTSMVPPFDVVYSNNSLVVELFRDSDVQVVKTPLFNRMMYSGSMIRELMLAGKEWRHLVPDSVAGVIDDIDGTGRIQRVAGSDKEF